MSEADMWKVFEESQQWVKLSQRLQMEMTKRVNQVRANIRQDGKVAETAYAGGCADTLEMVMNLPKRIRREIAERATNEIK